MKYIQSYVDIFDVCTGLYIYICMYRNSSGFFRFFPVSGFRFPVPNRKLLTFHNVSLLLNSGDMSIGNRNFRSPLTGTDN